MTPEANDGQSSSEDQIRQDRLEQRVAELSSKVERLERRIALLAPSNAIQDASAEGRRVAPPSPRPAPPSLGPDVAGPKLHVDRGRGASLETRIGSQLFNRVGIIALLIGATWFLKLAVDNGWVGPLGRVLIGLAAGVGIIFWSEHFRRERFLAFSYSLKAIGAGVLYLALWAAFQLFHLLPASVALAAMVLVTAWTAYMAWSQHAEILAAYALAGGFATPLLLSTGGNHQVFLFTYLLAMDLACVALVRLRSWSRLLLAALPFTVAYFIGWYARFFSSDQAASTIVFILAFFAVFLVPVFSVPPEAPAPESARGTAGELISHVLLPLANAGFVSLALFSVLQDSGHHDVVAWVMVALSTLYLGLIRLPQPRTTTAVHLSLAVVFLTIAIPLKAHGRWITVGWLAEGAALLWTSTGLPKPADFPSPEGTVRVLSQGALCLGFLGTLYHLIEQSSVYPPVFFSRSFATALFALAAFAASAWLAWHAPSAPDPLTRFGFPFVAASAVIAFNLIAIITGVVQINSLDLYSGLTADASLQRALAVSAFLMLYGALLLAVGFWRRNAFVRWQALILLVFSICKTFLYDMRNLSQGYRVLSFVGLGALLMAVSFAYQKDWLSLRDSSAPSQPGEAPLE